MATWAVMITRLFLKREPWRTKLPINLYGSFSAGIQPWVNSGKNQKHGSPTETFGDDRTGARMTVKFDGFPPSGKYGIWFLSATQRGRIRPLAKNFSGVQGYVFW
jgi:hypothetical protein